MKKIFVTVLALFSLVSYRTSAAEQSPDLTSAAASAAQVSTVTTKAPPPPKPSLPQQIFEFPWADVGIGYWHTNSKLDSYVHAGSDWISSTGDLRAYEGDVISKLRNKLGSEMLLINADARLFWRFYVDGFMGLGEFGGEHKDYDWHPQERPDIISLSSSDADGIVRTWNLNGDIRLIEDKDKKFYFDLALGYLFYRDDIQHLHNSTGLISNYESENVYDPLHDSSDKYTFQGFRIGARSRLEFLKIFAIKANAGVVPSVVAENRGYWNLRQTDFNSNANGVAYDLTGGLEVKITKNFFIEGGYKYMSFTTDKGDQRSTPGNGETELSYHGFSVDAERGGFYVMGRIKI